MRETYRLNKSDLIDAAYKSQTCLSILFSLSFKGYKYYSKLKFKDLNWQMTELLKQISAVVSKR